MKGLIFKIALPLSLISFVALTKWWYVLPIDAPDTLMSGFPLPFICDAWYTSMALQIFVIELIIDFFVYFIIWSTLIFLIYRFIHKFTISKRLSIAIYVLTALILTPVVLIWSLPENIYRIKRDFDIQVLETGFKFGWSNIERPNLETYALVQKDYLNEKRTTWTDVFKNDELEVEYINETSNPFLGNSYCRAIENVNFIDSIYILNPYEKRKLRDFIFDTSNFSTDTLRAERLFVYSGFVFKRNDTLIGTISMTYNYEEIEFSPNFIHTGTHRLTEGGHEKITGLIDKFKK